MNCVIIDNQDSFTYNLVEMVKQIDKANCLNLNLQVIQEKDLESNFAQQQISLASHIMISPGPLTPQDYPRLFKFIDQYKSTKSILGICLGFQLIGIYFGAKLEQLECPRHGKSEQLRFLQADATNEQTQVGLYHSWALDPQTIPPEITLIATDSVGIPMIIEHNNLPIIGVQFHPESYISKYGIELIIGWLTKSL